MRDKRCHSGDSTGHGIHALGLAHGSDPNAGWWPGKSIMRRDMMRTNTGSIRLTRGNSEVPDAILTMMGPIAQRSEPPAHNRSVPGSNAGGPTIPTEGVGARRAPRTRRLSTLRRTGTRRAQGIARNGESAMTTMCPAPQRGFFFADSPASLLIGDDDVA